MRDHTLNFNNEADDAIAQVIAKASNFHLLATEVGQGIVAPQDYLTASSAVDLKTPLAAGVGVFNLTNAERAASGFTATELELLKPVFTTAELLRYGSLKKNRSWVIYTDSSFKNPLSMKAYPNVRAHLDAFQPVITSSNKPYGLHRARDERFFLGEKIVVARKAPRRPTFTYTDYPCYVSQTFNVIKTDRVDLLYLTALLNSRLIAYWLRHQGKMQGDNYQLDKEPLLALPLVVADDTKPLHDLGEQLVALTSELYALTAKLETVIRSLFPAFRISPDDNWWANGVGDSLKSVGTGASLKVRAQITELYEDFEPRAAELWAAISGAEQSVDLRVYELYALDDETVSSIERG